MATHPPRALISRLALLLEPPEIQTVNDVLLSAALAPGAKQLAPLVLVVDRDVAEGFFRIFASGSPMLADRQRAIAILHELAEHGLAHDDDCSCAARGASLAPFARALMRVADPFYRRVGEILLRDVALALEPRLLQASPSASIGDLGSAAPM
jgi:hypothetical protein